MECNSGQVAPGSTYKVILGSTSLIDQQLILFIYLFSIKLFVGEILTQGTTNIFWYYPSTVTRFIIFIIYIYMTSIVMIYATYSVPKFTIIYFFQLHPLFINSPI
jgi:uncharacterized membrane protein